MSDLLNKVSLGDDWDLDDDYDIDDVLRTSTDNLGFIADKQREMMKLNEELDAKKTEVIRHATAVVREQEDRLNNMDSLRRSRELTNRIRNIAASQQRRASRSKLKRSINIVDDELAINEAHDNSSEGEPRITTKTADPIPIDIPSILNRSLGKNEIQSALAREEVHMDSSDISTVKEESTPTIRGARRKERRQHLKELYIPKYKDKVDSEVNQSVAGLPPGISKDLPVEAQARLANAHVLALEERLKESQELLVLRERECGELKQESRALNEENSKLAKEKAEIEITLKKLEKSSAAHRNNAIDFEQKYQAKSKELSEVKKMVRQGDQEVNQKESRLQHTIDEMNRFKTSLREEKTNHKEALERLRRELDSSATEMRKISKQKADLLSTFRKQMKLIDTLKRQKTHLEVAKQLSFSQDEFNRALDSQLSSF